MTTQPELLVFTLGPKVDSRRHRLLAEAHSTEEIGLRQGCLDAAISAGRQAGCHLTLCSPAPLQLPLAATHLEQVKGSFGLRLETAIRSLLAESFRPLVVVGTDVPELACHHIRQALDGIRQDPDTVVLGPCKDGGIYLLALGRPIPGLAQAVRWGRPKVLGDLLRLLRAEGRPVKVLGESLRDLDRPADLDLWLHASANEAGRWRALRRSLRLIRDADRRPLPVASATLRLALWALPAAGRAPPPGSLP